MKKLLLILTLLFSVMFSSLSYAEWTYITKNTYGDEYYLDFETIRKNDGYVYYWYLSNYLEPSEMGNFSATMYHKGDCKLFRFKYLSYIFYKGPMGKGTENITEHVNNNWIYPSPDSVISAILENVCAQ